MPLKTLYIIPQYARSGVVCQVDAGGRREGEKCVSPRKIRGESDFYAAVLTTPISFDSTAARRRSTVCRGARVSSGPILRGEARSECNNYDRTRPEEPSRCLLSHQELQGLTNEGRPRLVI